VVFRGDGEPRIPELMLDRMRRYHETVGYEADDFSRGGTVEILERRFAEVLGKEEAVFMPTGTLANHLAIRRLCGPRRRAVVQEQGHIYNDTGDTLPSLSGINLIPLGADRTSFSVDELGRALERADTGRVANPVGAVVIESPVRRQAGQVVPFEDMKAVARLCRERGVGAHLDGARLFMMSAATGVRPAEYAALFDTVYVSLYKYFGTPFGAMLAGNADTIDGLYHDRRMFGSGLPSSTLIAGLALQGLDGFEERFARAMQQAARLFDALNRLPGISIQPFDHGSNIFPLELSPEIDPVELASDLAAHGVYIYPQEEYRGSVLLHVNTTVLRRSNDDISEAFRQSLGRVSQAVA
jgi:threonine aldolase